WFWVQFNLNGAFAGIRVSHPRSTSCVVLFGVVYVRNIFPPAAGMITAPRTSLLCPAGLSEFGAFKGSEYGVRSERRAVLLVPAAMRVIVHLLPAPMRAWTGHFLIWTRLNTPLPFALPPQPVEFPQVSPPQQPT